MERRVLLAFVLGLIIIGIPLAAQSYMLSRQFSNLESQIGLINQEIDALWEEINMLKVGNTTSDTMIFTWGPKTQKIVKGTFRLEIRLTYDGENLTVIVKANDDDYDPADYVGLVFFNNDAKYEPYGLFADNMTITPSILLDGGFLGFPMYPPELGPQKVTFNPETGYTFTVKFPWVDQYRNKRNPVHLLEKGWNILHVCFHDFGGGGVFVRFDFLFQKA